MRDVAPVERKLQKHEFQREPCHRLSRAVSKSSYYPVWHMMLAASVYVYGMRYLLPGPVAICYVIYMYRWRRQWGTCSLLASAASTWPITTYGWGSTRKRNVSYARRFVAVFVVAFLHSSRWLTVELITTASVSFSSSHGICPIYFG